MAASLPDSTDQAEPASVSGPAFQTSQRRRELWLRVISAIVMAPLGIWVVLAGGAWLAIATAICAALAAYEWSRMMSQSRSSRHGVYLTGLMVAVAIASTLLALQSFPLSLAVSATGAAIASVLVARSKASMGEAALGLFYVTIPFAGFVYLRENVASGGWLIVAIMAVVWSTDIAAFLAGRGFGGPRLAPQGSPNKTWSGAIGALCCATITGAVISRVGGQSVWVWLLVAAAVSVLAQLGDMAESKLKRHFGVKDASGLIPGHGGVLDRLDSLMACSVVLAFIDLIKPGLLDQLVGG